MSTLDVKIWLKLCDTKRQLRRDRRLLLCVSVWATVATAMLVARW